MENLGTISSMQNVYVPTPPKVIAKQFELYDLIENKSENGLLSASDVAKYYGIRYGTFNKLVRNRALPFAFGDGTSDRIQSYISIVPLWNYESQNQLLSQVLWAKAANLQGE